MQGSLIHVRSHLKEGPLMRRAVGLISLCIALTAAFPHRAVAQIQATASIAGVVKDSSGAVLPGVTVEAASAALIERVRTAVTDEQGAYQVTDLRPGVYSVTFTLTGFRAVHRE